MTLQIFLRAQGYSGVKNMKQAFLGIDLGTGGIKAVLADENGIVLGSGFREIGLSILKPGFAEQNPLEWWEATVHATREAVNDCDEKPKVLGIGISGQMLGSVLLDECGKVIEDCIIWMDQRADQERDEIEALLGRELILKKTSNYPLTSYWAPKLMWLQNHRPHVFKKINKVLFPKDYLKYCMTGEMDIDVTDATGSMLFNTAGRCWEQELFEKLSLPLSIVPESISESVQVIGSLTKKAAGLLGLKSGIPVVSGAGDQMCGAVGMGVTKEGVVSSTIGTSGVVFSYSGTCLTDDKDRAALSYCHAVPNKWCMYGCTMAAGGAYKWLKDQFFDGKNVHWDVGGKSIYQYMDEMASASSPGSDGLTFLPYLNGERTPYPDPNARGVFFGISSRHGPGEFCRAVMEGVVFSLKDIFMILDDCGISVSEVRASGGGANSALWLQMQADIFNACIVTTNVAETPAVGAAILAAVGTGYFPSVEYAADCFVRPSLTIEPDSKNIERYQEEYQIYRSLYPALKGIYANQAKNMKRRS